MVSSTLPTATSVIQQQCHWCWSCTAWCTHDRHAGHQAVPFLEATVKADVTRCWVTNKLTKSVPLHCPAGRDSSGQGRGSSRGVSSYRPRSSSSGQRSS
jgi:hypothetical protein